MKSATKISVGSKGHTWVSNAAFSRLTGIKRVCLYCGATNLDRKTVCPGPKKRRKVKS